MVTISDIKSTLHQYVVETDDMEVLNEVKEYFRSMLKNKVKVIGYTSEGQALDIKAYKKDIDQARQQVKEGKTISQDQIEIASENW